MFAKASVAFLAVLLPATAQETANRVFTFEETRDVQGLQEVVNILHTVAGIQAVSVNNELKSVTVRGTPNEIHLAEWLVAALDSPATQVQEYRPPENISDDRLRVFHLTYAQNPRDLQEMATLIRSLADAQYIFIYTPSKALALRGNSWRISLAEWLIGELNQPPDTPPPAGLREYRLPSVSDIRPPADVFVRIFYTSARTTEALTGVLGGMRSAVNGLGRAYINTARRAVVVRASREKIMAAEQALRHLEIAN